MLGRDLPTTGCRSKLLTGCGGGGGEGEEPKHDDGKKTRFSISHSILSGSRYQYLLCWSAGYLVRAAVSL